MKRNTMISFVPLFLVISMVLVGSLISTADLSNTKIAFTLNENNDSFICVMDHDRSNLNNNC